MVRRAKGQLDTWGSNRADEASITTTHSLPQALAQLVKATLWLSLIY